jgi:hypothetical protein
MGGGWVEGNDEGMIVFISQSAYLVRLGLDTTM